MATLQNSHIVPEFVERRLKEESRSPFFRGLDPNVRTQSSKTLSLLCRKCEERFSDVETIFAKTFYHPTLDGDKFEICWDERHVRFLASVTWRALVLALRESRTPNDDRRDEDWNAIKSAEARLRPYLLAMREYPGEIEHHVFVAGAAAETEYDGVNSYLNMAIASGTPATEEAVYCVVVIPGVVVVALLQATESLRALWNTGGTLVEPGAVSRNHGHKINDSELGYYLVESAQRERQRHAQVSEKQKAVIAAATRKIIVSPGSRVHRAWMQDATNRRVHGKGQS